MSHKNKDKFKPKWQGSFVVETIYSTRAYRLINKDSDRMMMPIDDKFLKKYK